MKDEQESQNVEPIQEVIEALPKLPKNISSVVEPFAGGCAITLNILKQFAGKELEYRLNDIDGNKINFLLCMQTDPQKLKKKCIKLLEKLESTTDEEKFFKDIVQKHKSPVRVSMENPNFKTATQYMYLSIVSLYNKLSTLEFGTVESHAKKFQDRIDNIDDFHEIIKKVSLSRKTYLAVLKGLERPENIRNTLFLLDPPYLYTTEHSNTNGEFKFDMQDHENIAEFSHKLDDSNIFILFCRYNITNKNKHATDETLIGFYKCQYGYLAKLQGKQFYERIIEINKAKEVIISNYPFKGFQKI